MKHTLLLLPVLALVGVAGLNAQINLSSLDGLASKATESAVITLDPTTLQMASKFLSSRNGDHPDVKNLLAGLKSITVRNFEFDKEGQYRMEDLQPIMNQLRPPAWGKIIDVTEKDEKSEIYTKTENGQVVGFVILNAEPKELSVVSIEGTIDLSTLANMGGQLGIPAIPFVGQGNQGKKKGKQ